MSAPDQSKSVYGTTRITELIGTVEAIFVHELDEMPVGFPLLSVNTERQ